jgi:uncharacterized protein YjbJ (UPF0337 family)
MRRSAGDRAKGKLHEVKGTIKEKLGRATNNTRLAAEGRIEKIGGKFQKTIGQAEKALGE